VIKAKLGLSLISLLLLQLAFVSALSVAGVSTVGEPLPDMSNELPPGTDEAALRSKVLILLEPVTLRAEAETSTESDIKEGVE